ncbi:MAG: hypothetical protein NC307_11480 [Roseburia sp.]|nr:hypothetical protein [Roseburia sp.]
MNKFDNMVKGLGQELEVPEKVWAKYVQTLENLPEKEVRRNRHTGKWAAAAAVMALVLVGTTTYAATTYFGLWDFMEWRGGSMPKEAKELVVKDVPQSEEPVTEKGVASYQVKEAMCDSESIYIVIEASATEPGKYLFVPEDAITGEDPMSDWGVDSAMTAAEYADSKGLTPVHIGGGISNTKELGIGSCALDFRSVSDDVMDIMISGAKTQDGKTLDVICQGTAWEDGVDIDGVMRTEITFTLNDTSSSEKLCYVPEIGVIPGTDARVELAEVIQTEVGTYIEITYYEDDPDFSSGLTFRLPEETGAHLTSGGTESIGEGKWKAALNLDKIELGESFSLEAFDCYEKNVFGTVLMNKEQ